MTAGNFTTRDNTAGEPMSLTILDDSMISEHSPHTARLLPGGQQTWEVSWLPGRPLDRNSAITAMVLADATSPGDMHADHPNWVFYQGWAAELGMTADQAVIRIAGPPAWAATAETAPVRADPEAGA